jgi:penicillin-binding protein 1A
MEKPKLQTRIADWFRRVTRRGKRRATTGNKKLQRAATVAPRSKLRIALTVAKWSAIVGLALTAIGAAVIAGMFWYYGSDPSLPKISSLADYEPLQVTRIVTADGKVVGELYEQRRTYVPIEEVPEVVVNAFVSAEDASFFEHGGIDYWGMLRAVFVNVKAGEKRQGASTITQQVVKTFLLSPERTFKRKFQEIILARRLENSLSKREILALYLNQIYFGHGRYGIAEAARFYFGKNVGDLTVGEAAMLAGLPKAPENISPKKPENAGRAKSRQKYVLEQMAHNGYTEASIARKFIDAPIEIIDEPFPYMNTAPEWVDLVRRELVARYGEDRLYKLGLTVEITLDLEMQEQAHEALRSGLRELDKRQKLGRRIDRVKADKIELQLAKYARRLPDNGPRTGESYRAVVLEVHDAAGEEPATLVVDLGNWKAAVPLIGESEERFNPKGEPASERFEVGDIVRVERNPKLAIESKYAERVVELAPGPEGAVVVIDPRTRQVLALVGGYGTRVADFNRATMAKRQAGSTFKPFVYATAIDNGEFTAASIINDAPEVYDEWKPQNYKKEEFEGPVRLRYALAKSINTVSIRLIQQVGPARVAALAHSMGIESELPEHRSLALGSGEITPLELTNAFATFAAGGRAAPAQLIRKLDDEVVQPVVPEQVMRPEVAYVLTNMMRSVVQEGTGQRARGLRPFVVGKTGTTDDAKDAWFIGMTPTLVVGVWVGYDEPRRLGGKEGGARSALPVFVSLLESLGKSVPPQPFERPPGVVDARVDKATGLLAPAGATDENSYVEVFVEGTVPVEVAPAANEVDVDEFILEQYGDDAATATAADDADGAEPTATP